MKMPIKFLIKCSTMSKSWNSLIKSLITFLHPLCRHMQEPFQQPKKGFPSQGTYFLLVWMKDIIWRLLDAGYGKWSVYGGYAWSWSDRLFMIGMAHFIPAARCVVCGAYKRLGSFGSLKVRHFLKIHLWQIWEDDFSAIGNLSEDVSKERRY